MVSESITGAYIVYAAITIGFLAVRPTAQVALAALFAGWLFLPVEVYPAYTITVESFTVEVIGTVLPSQVFVTKAWVAPVSVLFGLILGARGLPGAVRLIMADLGMVAFCTSPLAAMLVDRIPVSAALAQSLYLFGVWGSTWLIGRTLLGGNSGREALVSALIGSGLALLPVALLEAARPAWLYTFVYGPHPFQLEGNIRYLGYRPMGLLEHGNQYGIWMAAAALAAVFRCQQARQRALRDIAVASLLTVAAVASQSVGAIILLLAALAWLITTRTIRRSAMIAVALLVGIGAPVYLSGKLPLERWATATPLGQSVISRLRDVGRNSIAYRIRRDQMALPIIFQAPLTGTGTWDWWRPLKSHPWGLPLLIAGQYGLLSLFVLVITLMAGTMRRLWHGRTSVLALVVLIAAIDAFFNSYIFFPMTLAAGALAVSLRPLRRQDAGMKKEDGDNLSLHALD